MSLSRFLATFVRDPLRTIPRSVFHEPIVIHPASAHDTGVGDRSRPRRDRSPASGPVIRQAAARVARLRPRAGARHSDGTGRGMARRHEDCDPTFRHNELLAYVPAMSAAFERLVIVGVRRPPLPPAPLSEKWRTSLSTSSHQYRPQRLQCERKGASSSPRPSLSRRHHMGDRLRHRRVARVALAPPRTPLAPRGSCLPPSRRPTCCEAYGGTKSRQRSSRPPDRRPRCRDRHAVIGSPAGRQSRYFSRRRPRDHGQALTWALYLLRVSRSGKTASATRSKRRRPAADRGRRH